MDKKRHCLIICLTAMLSVITPACQGSQLFFSPDATGTTGSVEGHVPLDRLDCLPLARGRVTLSGNQIDITTIAEWQFDRQVVLSGRVLETAVSIKGPQATISGVVFFLSGDWLKYIDDQKAPESVITAQAETTGRITAITEDQVELKDAAGALQHIHLSEIKKIRSPRAYTFKIPATAPSVIAAGKPFQAVASRLDLSATERPFRACALKSELCRQGDGDYSTRKLILIGTGLSLIELGQLAPVLAVPLGANPLRRAAFFKALQIDAAGLQAGSVVPGAH